MAEGRLIRDSDSIDSDLAVLADADADSDSTASGLVFRSGDMDQAGHLLLIMDMERRIAGPVGDSGDLDGDCGGRPGAATVRLMGMIRGDGVASAITDTRESASVRRMILDTDIQTLIRQITTRITTELSAAIPDG